MAGREINLLQINKAIDQQKILEKYTKSGLWVIIFYVCLVGIIFGVYVLLVFQENKIKGDVVKAETEVKSLKKTESLQAALENRITVINDLLDKQSDFSSSIEKSKKLFPDGLVINKISFISEKISSELSVPTYEQLSEFLRLIKENKTDFGELVVGPVNRESNGSYTIFLNGKLAEKQ